MCNIVFKDSGRARTDTDLRREWKKKLRDPLISDIQCLLHAVTLYFIFQSFNSDAFINL